MISKQYAQRDARELGEYYTKHVQAMTAEGLHSKSDIAAELAYRDQLIDSQKEQLRKWVSGEWRFAHRLSIIGNSCGAGYRECDGGPKCRKTASEHLGNQ